MLSQPDLVADLSHCTVERDARKYAWAFQTLKSRVMATVRSKGSTYAGWSDRWWQPWRPRREAFSEGVRPGRFIVCSRHAARPVYCFISGEWFPTESLQIFQLQDDYSFGIIQSMLHWEWALAQGTKIKADTRYTAQVWKSFPWPQAPTVEEVAAVASAARELRATRRRLMDENGWSLRDLHQAAEVAGPHPLKQTQAALDTAVEAAYGKPADQEPTEFLLEMNLALAEDEGAGETIQGPGLPAGYDPKDPRWFSTDCIEPPPLELDEDDHG